MLGVLRMYIKFGFEWCAGGCESVGGDLGDRWYFHGTCFPLCGVDVEDLYGCCMLCNVRKRLSSMRVCSMHLRWICLWRSLFGLGWGLGACILLLLC